MERISAACAMEWSIELEKGLRSKKHDRSLEAILQIGPRIERWSKEPRSTMGVLHMFGLVTGEDRLFANTILLRLADAFKHGDTHTRLCVLRVFIFARKQSSRKGESYLGFLAKETVPNYLELLKRVKIVYDTGDVQSRALALRLLGCWASFAKDSAEVRYMILSSLESVHALEVKASLFVAGCFSELSEDFAFVVLEVLINLVTSSKTSSTLKVAAAQAFAKMGLSSTLASTAYKTGRKLVLESSEEGFILEMLMPLSKLASKSMLLISWQVDLLLSFISKRFALCVQSMALRCIYILLVGGACRFPMTSSLLEKFFHMLDNNNLPTASECKALRILCKIFSSRPSLSDMEMTEFTKWVSIVESATQSPTFSKRLLAFQTLVHMSCNKNMAMILMPSANDSTPFPSQVILLVLDQLARLLKPMLRCSESAFKLRQEYKSLLTLVLCMVEEYPFLVILTLTKVRSCLESLLDASKHQVGAEQESFVHNIVMLEAEKHSPVASKLVGCMYRFLDFFIGTLSEASAINSEVHHNVKLLIHVLHESFLKDICTIDVLLLHSGILWNGWGTENKGVCSTNRNLVISHNEHWIEHERYTFEYIRKMLEGRNNWDAYKAGKFAACQGTWFLAAYIFSRLENRVQSDVCHHWLKSHALFARAESTILLLHTSVQSLLLANSSVVGEIWVKPHRAIDKTSQGVDCTDEWLGHCKKLNDASSDICSAVKMLGATGRMDRTFIFQRWFMVLRGKILEALVDILKLSNSREGNEGSIGTGLLGARQKFHSLSYFLIQISFQLSRLAQEFDRLATSFMDMDAKSFRTISRLALCCSLLGFCTGFTLYFPDLQLHDNSRYWDLKKFKRCSPSFLIHDLIERLWHIDDDMTTNLKQLLTSISEPNSCIHVPPRALVYKVGLREREILDVCSFALTDVLWTQKEAKGINDEGEWYRVSKIRLQHLSNILTKWMNLSFQVPTYFFQARPCNGAELFAANADTKNPDGLSVSPGSRLSLNLCLQMKSAPAVKVTKFYCIVASKPSKFTAALGGECKGQFWLGFQALESDDTEDLYEKLWLHLTESAKRTVKKHRSVPSDDGSVWSFASFEPNEKGQGFSTCLLDVSAFPVGSYKINWYSCCIDAKGSHWTLLPLNTCPAFSVKKAG